MSITITITGDAAEVRAHMAALLGHQPAILPGEFDAGHMMLVEPTETPVDLRNMTLGAGPLTPTGEALLNPPAEETRKRGRPRKDAGAAEAPAPSSEPASSIAEVAQEPSSPAEYVMTAAEAEAHRAPNAVPPEASLEDVRDALRALAGAKGTDPCSALLKKFGASKSSELKPEDRAAFVAEAKALVDA